MESLQYSTHTQFHFIVLTNKIDGSCFFTFAFAKAEKQRAFFSIEKIDTIWEIYCQTKKTVNTWKFSEGKLIVSSDQSQ